MGKIYDEFCIHLKNTAEKHKNNPDAELYELLLLALEREKLVSTAYRDSLLFGHINAQPIPGEFKTIFRHAFRWIWMDEEMHTTYTRGALLQLKKKSVKPKILSSQMAGLVGGWASSVLQLTSWTKFPFSYSAAKIITWAGSLSGKVPKEIKGELKSGTLKKFCAFNVDAEQTAWICWKRIVELAEKDPQYSASAIRDFKKIIFDEHRHEQIFEIIHNALDENDALLPGITLDELVEKISKVSDYFLPKNYRTSTIANNPIEAESCVWSYYNQEALPKSAAFKEFIHQTNLQEKLEEQMERLQIKAEDLKVVIKVSFTMGYNKKDLSPITDIELLNELIAWLNNKHIKKIQVTDVQTMYGNFFENRDVAAVAAYYGFNSSHYEIVDASTDQIDHHYSRGIGIYKISQSWKDAHFRISFGKLKSHPAEMALLSIGNLEWLVGNCEDFIFLDKMSERPITTMNLLDEFPPHYALLDAYENIPFGLVGVMGSKKPAAPKRFYASANSLALDTVVMGHLGMKEFHTGSILKTVEYWFGDKQKNIQVVGHHHPITEWKGPNHNLLWAILSLISNPIYLFFSQRGALFIPRMDEQAFPEKKKAGFIIRVLRNINRRIIGLNGR